MSVNIPKEPTSQEKGELSGEFYIEIEHSCSACNYDEIQDDCEVCFGEISYTQKHAVPWTLIKDIRAKLVGIYD